METLQAERADCLEGAACAAQPFHRGARSAVRAPRARSHSFRGSHTRVCTGTCAIALSPPHVHAHPYKYLTAHQLAARRRHIKAHRSKRAMPPEVSEQVLAVLGRSDTAVPESCLDVQALLANLAELTARVEQLESARASPEYEVEIGQGALRTHCAEDTSDDAAHSLPDDFVDFLVDYVTNGSDCNHVHQITEVPEALALVDGGHRPSSSIIGGGDWSAERRDDGHHTNGLSLSSAGKAVVRHAASRASAIWSAKSGTSSVSVSAETELDVHFCDDQPVELSRSIWDVALLAWCRHISTVDSALIIFLMLLNIAAQSIFLGIVYYIFMEQKFTDRFQAHLLEWRTHVGHNIQYYDPYTFSSLTERVCQPDKHTPELSSYISEQVETMHTFLDKGNAILNGQSLLLVAILCWTLTIMREVASAWNISRAARCLPRHVTRIVQPRSNTSHVCRLSSISKKRKMWWDTVIFMRVACALVLWALGCRFLCLYSITPEAVLLDVVALEVVLSVDEAVFTLAPRAACEIVERLEPLKAAPRLCRFGRTDLRPFFLTTIVVATLLFCSSWMVMPLVDRVVLANATICGGAQDFVYTIDPLQVVHYARTNPDGVDVMEAQSFPSFAAVQELWERLDDLESLRDGPPLLALAHSLEDLELSEDISINEASGALQTLADTTCGDLLDRSPSLLRYSSAVMQWAVEHPDFGWVGVPSASGCADLEPTCPFLDMTRALCPTTCGCHDPLGSILAAAPEHGCPAACTDSATFRKALTELPCDEATAVELRKHSTWRAWAAQLNRLLRGRYAGGASLPPPCGGNCEELMLRDGCRIIEVWRERMGADPCNGAWTSTEPTKISRPLSMLCPLTCGCPGPSIAESAL